MATQAQNQGYVLAHPNVHPICDLLEYGAWWVWDVSPVDPGLQDL